MKKTHLFILLSLLACGVINGPVVAMERSDIEKLLEKKCVAREKYKKLLKNYNDPIN